MGKARSSASAQRASSIIRGLGDRGRSGGEGTAIQGTGSGAGGRRGRVADLDEGTETDTDTDTDTETRDADGATALLELPPTATTATTTTTTRKSITNIRINTTNTSAAARIVRGEQNESGRGLLSESLREEGWELELTERFKESRTVACEFQEDDLAKAQFESSTSVSVAPPQHTRSHPAPTSNQPAQPLRQSPEPHPQPQRYILKFERRVLEKSQAKQAEQRRLIKELLERQQAEAVCVSTLVRERDLDMVPSLEGPLSLRSGRARGGVVEGENQKENQRARVNGFVDEKTTANSNTGTNGVKGVVRNGRPRDKENQINGHANGNGIHVNESPPQLVNAITIPERTKPLRPKKMELELRIDSPSTDKDKETLERNIDNVIFGEVTFKAWYPSWYPKEIIGEKALTVGAGDKGGIVVNELYVCQRCFGYGKMLVEWVRHCRCCEREVPGRKVYVHGGWREDDSPRPAVGMWSIWEVDGGVETMFCQKLSLFAKLFLDNKSVFFDVSGFNYFLLVYTPPSNSPHNHPSSPTTTHKQIIGFFSKEKLSWDNNNLACILIFPPWQRKGLGALLMGVSYAIARREQILGGPEKPISDLGRKGYKRFWGAEIARWILERPDGRKIKGKARKREEVSIKLLSEETWIAQDDCLGVLRDMGVVECFGGRARVSAGSADGEEKEVAKVRIDKEAVRRWCESERIKLERVVGEEGFRPGYAERVEDEEQGEGEKGDGEVEEGADVEMGG